MVNVDLVAQPPTEGAFEEQRKFLERMRSKLLGVLGGLVFVLLIQIVFLWMSGKITAAQVPVILCAPMVSYIVSLLLVEHLKMPLSAVVGFGVGIIAMVSLGMAPGLLGLALLGSVASGTGVIWACTMLKVWSAEREILKVTPLQCDYDYTWLCFAAVNSDFVVSYLLQVRYSGRRDIYGEELLRLLPYGPEELDMPRSELIKNPKMALWTFIETLG